MPPKLSFLGDLCSLTETGSMTGAEDGSKNNMHACMETNTVFNMCGKLRLPAQDRPTPARLKRCRAPLIGALEVAYRSVSPTRIAAGSTRPVNTPKPGAAHCGEDCGIDRKSVGLTVNGRFRNRLFRLTGRGPLTQTMIAICYSE